MLQRSAARPLEGRIAAGRLGKAPVARVARRFLRQRSIGGRREYPRSAAIDRHLAAHRDAKVVILVTLRKMLGDDDE